MPRNTREWAHRKLEQARQNLNWAGTHIQEVKERYQDAHPEIAKVLDDSQQVLILADTTIEALKKSF